MTAISPGCEALDEVLGAAVDSAPGPRLAYGRGRTPCGAEPAHQRRPVGFAARRVGRVLEQLGGVATGVLGVLDAGQHA